MSSNYYITVDEPLRLFRCEDARKDHSIDEFTGKGWKNLPYDVWKNLRISYIMPDQVKKILKQLKHQKA